MANYIIKELKSLHAQVVKEGNKNCPNGPTPDIYVEKNGKTIYIDVGITNNGKTYFEHKTKLYKKSLKNG